MNMTKTFAPALALSLTLNSIGWAQSGEAQGFSVTIMNICGTPAASETIEIQSVTLTLNAAPIASQPGPRSLRTGQMTTFQFPTSQFPILATLTPNDITVVWRRGQISTTTVFFPIEIGKSREQSCLRVLLVRGVEGETGAVFSQLQGLISQTASRLGVSTDPSQAKMFQISSVPMAMAPVTAAGPTVGVMELGSPMNIGGTLLSPGSYRMDVDFAGGKVLFRDPSGIVRAETPARIEPVAGPSGTTQEPLVLTAPTMCQTTTSSDEPVEPMAFAGCVGPTITFSLAFIPIPPFVLLLTCIGFLCHPFHPLPPYVSVGFCF